MKHQKFFLVGVITIFILSCLMGQTCVFAEDEPANAYVYTPESDEAVGTDERMYIQEETDRYYYEDAEEQATDEDTYIDEERYADPEAESRFEEAANEPEDR